MNITRPALSSFSNMVLVSVKWYVHLGFTGNCFFVRSLVEYMNEKVNYVVTHSSWDENFDEV